MCEYLNLRSRYSKGTWWLGMHVAWISAQKWATSAGLGISCNIATFLVSFLPKPNLFDLQWWRWRQGLHLGLENNKVVVKVEGAWRCLHSGNLLAFTLHKQCKTTPLSNPPYLRFTTTCRYCGTPMRPARWQLLGGTAWSSFGIEIAETGFLYSLEEVLCNEGFLLNSHNIWPCL